MLGAASFLLLRGAAVCEACVSGAARKDGGNVGRLSADSGAGNTSYSGSGHGEGGKRGLGGRCGKNKERDTDKDRDKDKDRDNDKDIDKDIDKDGDGDGTSSDSGRGDHVRSSCKHDINDKRKNDADLGMGDTAFDFDSSESKNSSSKSKHVSNGIAISRASPGLLLSSAFVVYMLVFQSLNNMPVGV